MQEEKIRAKLRELHASPSRDERLTATLERDLWSRVKDRLMSEGKKADKKRWFEDNFGVRGYIINARAGLLAHDEFSGPLWEAVSSGSVQLAAASRVAARASKSDDPASVIAAYVKDPARTNRELKRGSRAGPSAGGDAGVSPGADVSASKRFYAGVRDLTSSFVDERLEDVEDHGQRQKIKDDFEFSMRSAYETLLRDIRNLCRTSKSHEGSVTRSQVVRAFGQLGLGCPRNIRREHLEEARRIFKAESRDLHPDRNNNDHSLVEQYTALQEAWAVIKNVKIEE